MAFMSFSKSAHPLKAFFPCRLFSGPSMDPVIKLQSPLSHPLYAELPLRSYAGRRPEFQAKLIALEQ
jgi:hypothetical protein